MRKPRHTSPRGFLGDMEKYNAAAMLGWTVARTTPDRLMGEGVELIMMKARKMV